MYAYPLNYSKSVIDFVEGEERFCFTKWVTQHGWYYILHTAVYRISECIILQPSTIVKQANQ